MLLLGLRGFRSVPESIIGAGRGTVVADTYLFFVFRQNILYLSSGIGKQQLCSDRSTWHGSKRQQIESYAPPKPLILRSTGVSAPIPSWVFLMRRG